MTSIPVRVTRAIQWCLILCALPLAAGCGKSRLAGPATGALPVPTVTVVKPERATVRCIIEQPAHVEAYEQTPLVARIAGYVSKVQADIGDRVRGPRFNDKGEETEPGQLLAELRVPEVEEELKHKIALVAQAEAELEQARSALEAAEANIDTTKATIREAQAARSRSQANCDRWESEAKRMDALVLRKVIDEQSRDETRNQAKAAHATCQEAEARVHSCEAAARESVARRNKAKADSAAAEARIRVAQAEEGRLRALLQYSKIVAPFDGVVVQRHIHTGHFLQPGTGGNAASLFVVARLDIVRVFVNVPEADSTYVSQGMPARIRVQSIKDKEFVGKVARTSWSVDAKARTLRAEIDLPNPDGRLRPGMFATATLTAEFPDRFTVPATAVQTQGDQSAVFVVEDGTVRHTPVRLGLRNGASIEILQKLLGNPTAADQGTWANITGSERIVQANGAALNDKQAVNVTQ